MKVLRELAFACSDANEGNKVSHMTLGLAMIAAGVLVFLARKRLGSAMRAAWPLNAGQDPRTRRLAELACGFVGLTGIVFGVFAVLT